MTDSYSGNQREDNRPIDMLTGADRKTKVAVVYAVCYHFRVPIFRRLSNRPGLQVRLFVGSGMPGTKTVNAKDMSGLDVTKMWTLKRKISSSGRSVALFFNPGLFLYLLRWSPDVLLVQGGEPLNNFLVLLYARLFGKPIVWWSLGEVRGRQYSKFAEIYRKATQFIERRATAYLGYSSTAVDYFVRMGYEPRRCFNLVNVVDTDLVKENMVRLRPTVEPLRDALNLRNKRVVLYVGALTDTKQVDRLLRAFAQINVSAPDIHLLIVGDGPERKSLEDLAEQLSISKQTHFVGAIYEQSSAYFQLADLLVVPGTGGLVISEAMTHGLAVISSVGDGSELDLIDEGVNGFCIPEHGVEILSERMRECLGDLHRLKKMGEESQNIIDSRYNIRTYMNTMFECIDFASRADNGSERQ